ncbi:MULTISPECIES: SDR family NAD(P)-dependent oxidoreductase [unclassified Variovorax]|uniref:SDR family NAD(P)-dependent oxidoreductase n=1 Tax=unclassified Variovorax TaxID=663243 RepID=UPI001BD405A8|nr:MULTISPECIES: SDR family oxidoreductase [unclassified Variovorax]
MTKLNDKIAIVTGSGRGVGLAVARKLAQEGASVVVNDIDEAEAEQAVADLRAQGAKAVAVVGDVCANGFAERLVNTTLSNFGGIDILVNNAGYGWDRSIQNTSDDHFQAMLDIHVVAPFRILRAASGFIRSAAKDEAQRGLTVHRKVVNVSSMAICGIPGQAAYASGKAAVVGLTKSLSKEWGRYRVNVNCVAFGLIRTRLTRVHGAEGPDVTRVGDREFRVGLDEAGLAEMNRRTALGRQGEPEDAAGGVYLLCTPESDFITGQVLFVSGGASV